MSEIGKLWVTLEARSGSFLADMDVAEKRFEKTREAAERIGEGVRDVGIKMGAFGGAVVAAAGIAVVSLAKTTDALGDMSLRTGVGVKSLQELSYVMKLSGGSIEGLETGLRRMASTITDAGEGIQMSKDALNQLNLTFDDLAGLSPEEQFDKISQAMADIKDPTTRAAVAVDIFGRSGTSLLPMLAEGRDGIAKMRAEAGTFSTVLDSQTAMSVGNLNDDLDRLTMGFKSMWDQIALALLPTVKEFATAAKNIITDVKSWIKENQNLFNMLVKGVVTVAGIAAAFGSLLIVVGSIVAVLPTLGIALTVLTGPVGIVIGVIAALVAAGGLLIAHWDAVKYYTGQAWLTIKSTVLTAILAMMQGMTNYLSWVPGFGNSLKSATESIQTALLETTKQYETRKSDYQAEQAAKELAKLKEDAVVIVAEEKKTQTARKLSHEEMIRSLSASWAQFSQDYKSKTMNWYAELQKLGDGFQSSLSTGFNTTFQNIGKGWQALRDGAKAFGESIKNAMIQQLSDMAASWVMKHVVMATATKLWRTQEVAANAAVAASKAAATTAWSLWGAIATGALIGAAVISLAGKFERGGIVGGSSYSGDHVLAAVNSDEPFAAGAALCYGKW